MVWKFFTLFTLYFFTKAKHYTERFYNFFFFPFSAIFLQRISYSVYIHLNDESGSEDFFAL